MIENNSPRFELVIALRDSMGNPTGKTKSFTTDFPDELDMFWLRNNTTKNKEKYEQSKDRGNKSSKNTRKPKVRNGSDKDKK